MGDQPGRASDDSASFFPQRGYVSQDFASLADGQGQPDPLVSTNSAKERFAAI